MKTLADQLLFDYFVIGLFTFVIGLCSSLLCWGLFALLLCWACERYFCDGSVSVTFVMRSVNVPFVIDL